MKASLQASAVLAQVQPQQVLDMLTELGYEGTFRPSKKGYMLSTSICHGGSHYNLRYATEGHGFHCFSHCGKSYSLFDIVMLLKQCSFPQAVSYVARFIGYTKTEPKLPSQSIQFLKSFSQRTCTEEMEDTYYDESLLQGLLPLPYLPWIAEGITPDAQRFFEVGYSPCDERMMIPHRSWDSGLLMGLRGRTTIADYAAQDIPKWYPFPQFRADHNLYGYWQQQAEIVRLHELILTESEKSPMKARSMGIINVCAVSGHCISDEQTRILIALGIPTVIAFDRDIPKEACIAEAAKLMHYLDVSVIPSWNSQLLAEKDSPLDKSAEVWHSLYNQRITIR